MQMSPASFYHLKTDKIKYGFAHGEKSTLAKLETYILCAPHAAAVLRTGNV